MGKHSRNKGIFGPDGTGHSGPRPAKRRPPSAAAGKRRIPSQRSGMVSEPSEGRYSLSGVSPRRKGALEAAPERLRVERDRRRGRAKRVAAIGAGVLAVVVALGSAGIYAYAKHIESTMQRTLFQKEKLERQPGASQAAEALQRSHPGIRQAPEGQGLSVGYHDSCRESTPRPKRYG